MCSPNAIEVKFLKKVDCGHFCMLEIYLYHRGNIVGPVIEQENQPSRLNSRNLSSREAAPLIRDRRSGAEVECLS